MLKWEDEAEVFTCMFRTRKDGRGSISGGWARFICTSHLEEGAIIALRVQLPGATGLIHGVAYKI